MGRQRRNDLPIRYVTHVLIITKHMTLRECAAQINCPLSTLYYNIMYYLSEEPSYAKSVQRTWRENRRRAHKKGGASRGRGHAIRSSICK